METLTIQKERQSNFELLRIIMMLMIVLHHYCLNTGLMGMFDFNNISFNMILVQFASIGGKVGVNGFLILSGYFMIKKEMKWDKVIKLLAELLFYNVIITLFLYLMGYEYSVRSFISSIIPLQEIPESFIISYLMVYAISPLLNAGANALDRKKYIVVLVCLLVYFSVFETFLNIKVWNYFGWAMTMYLVGGFVKLNEDMFTTKKWPYIIIVLASILLCWASIIVFDSNILSRFSEKLGYKFWPYFIGKANMFFMFTFAFGLFMLFKNIKIKQNKVINAFAAASFGVLIIHAQSETMRQFLWRDTLKILDFYDSKLLWLHMLGSVLVVYIVCALIDIARNYGLEKPICKAIKKI